MNARQSSLSRHSGFTLIEVTFALGVMSFAFVGLLGLIPAGLQSFRSAIDTSVRSQIVQRVSSEAMQTDFDLLVSSSPADRYFDDQGAEVSPQRSTYQVRVSVASKTELPAISTMAENPQLATVRIRIANNPGHLADPYSGGTNIPVSETTTFVARNARL